MPAGKLRHFRLHVIWIDIGYPNSHNVRGCTVGGVVTPLKDFGRMGWRKIQ